jgi:hypothetical protein
MSKHGRVWVVFLLVGLLLVAADVAYLAWRERSLEPLSAPIDLTRPGTYVFNVRGFHASPYHSEFRLQLPFATDEQPWFPDDGYQQLWSGSPPRVRVEIRDGAGQTLLLEESALTRSDEWIVTGALGASEVEVYKFSEFDACMVCSYRVSLQVLSGSPAAASYQPHFEIAAVKAYALLPAVMGFVFLVVLLVLSAIVIAIVQRVRARRDRNPATQR